MQQTRKHTVISERQFIQRTVLMGFAILVVALGVALGVTWWTTRLFEPEIHQQALRTAGLLPLIIVPACVSIIGRQGWVNHRHMLEVTRLAHTDEMTGLANRRAFMADAVELLKATDIEYQGLCLFVIDLDYFKRVNDRFGHDAGDKALIHTARQILEALPHGSLVARLGGEEFAALVSYDSLMEVHKHAEAVRQRIAAKPCVYSDVTIQVTASLGASIAHPRDTISSMLTRADNALYEAKHEGRNRFAIAA